ncbi:hypothetical protein PV10_06517 [Exophiala mesophila]|uniref:Uncharacterized protein n=1 Tax=Exophiala mesophila TaxID=212818 RepID=A0A0D1ZBI5_EXOME|nr:uncharacterized protein PV10_06517 [Exophiala mesophila]KIV92042.1 hypothetical protein PV10_06517 [Exophiala mesophila]
MTNKSVQKACCLRVSDGGLRRVAKTYGIRVALPNWDEITPLDILYLKQSDAGQSLVLGRSANPDYLVQAVSIDISGMRIS